MSQDTNFGLIQLIQSGDLSVDLEIANIKAKKSINIYVRTYLNHSPDYLSIKSEIDRVVEKMELDLPNASFYSKHLEGLYLIEQNFVINALILARFFSNIEIRSERLKEALALFEAGKLKEADAILSSKDLFDDQLYLFALADYHESKLNL